jgi:hypothetical protein
MLSDGRIRVRLQLSAERGEVARGNAGRPSGASATGERRPIDTPGQPATDGAFTDAKRGCGLSMTDSRIDGC